MAELVLMTIKVTDHIVYEYKSNSGVITRPEWDTLTSTL